MNEHEDLKSAGLKVTHPRVRILSIFRVAETRHLSAEEVFKRLSVQQSDIGLATVYRVLTQLEEAGVLRRSNFNAGKAVFELNESNHHDHLICLGCGRAEEFNDAKIEKQQKVVADSFGYALSDHQLVLYGYCALCAAELAKGNSS
ncbi:ferric iron uptake transcriptional regulator [Propionivibrio sp.]|uniref:ferric iron uptake transcriptional regulator n=1 Tax=Propionivibrio sp. TaxID=2212460 RepID=UPI003BF06884